MLSVDIEKKLKSFHLKSKFSINSNTLGILGASGCGKSMTLRCIAGIEKPDCGRIVLDDVILFDSSKGIDLPPQKRQVGYLFQNYALFPNMTAQKNILCGLHYEKNKAKKTKDYEEIVRLLGLEGLENHRPAQLSGGQAQRVALARILVNKPRLLMLDEPFAALDIYLRDSLQIQLKQILEKYKGTAVVVTHSRNEVYQLCEKIAIMDKGAVLSLAAKEEVFENPGTIAGAVLMGCKNIVPAQKTGEYEVAVPDWGVRLKTAKNVSDGLCAVGIHSSSFKENAKENNIPFIKIDEINTPEEWILRFNTSVQKANAAEIIWTVSKDSKPKIIPNVLGVAPDKILLLYPA